MAAQGTVTCDGASGTAAGFITDVTLTVDGLIVGQHSHTPSEEGYSWSIPYRLEGDHVVVITDRTAGDDYNHAPSNTVVHVSISCPVLVTSTTVVTETSAPTSLVPSTTTGPLATVEQGTLTPPALPEGITFCAEDDPCWNCATMGNQVCGTTTVLWSPVGCCTDWSETTVGTPPTLPATGAAVAPMSELAAGLVFAGVALVSIKRVNRRTYRQQSARAVTNLMRG